MIRKIILKTMGLGGLLVFLSLLLLTIVSIYYNSIAVSFFKGVGVSSFGWIWVFGILIILGRGTFLFNKGILDNDSIHGERLFFLCLGGVLSFFILIFLFFVAFVGDDIGSNALFNYQIQNNKPYLLTQCGLNTKYINQVKQDDKKEGLLAKEVYMNCLEKLDKERSAIQPNVKGKYIAMFNSKGNGNFTKEFKEIKSLDKYVFENTLEILNKKEEQDKLIVEKAKTIVNGNNKPNDLYDILKAE